MKFLKKSMAILKILLTVVIIVLFTLYFIKNQDDFESVFSISPYIFLLLFGLNSFHFFVNGLFVLSILRRFDHLISGLESFYISIISSFANYFIPLQGGAVIRSVYLKKTLQFPYTHFIATLYGNYIVIFGVNALFAIITLLLIHIIYAAVPIALFLFFSLILFGMLVLVFLRIRFIPEKAGASKLGRKFLEVVSRILNGWKMISGDKNLLITFVLITVVNFLVMTFIYAIEFFALAVESNLLTILLYNCLAGVSLLISFTPGALGIKEGIYFVTSEVLVISREQIMLLALLDRGITVLTLFFWFVVLTLWRYYSNLKSEKSGFITPTHS